MCRLQIFIFETKVSGGWSVSNATWLIFPPLSFSTLISSSKRETQLDISKKIAWKTNEIPKPDRVEILRNVEDKKIKYYWRFFVAVEISCIHFINM